MLHDLNPQGWLEGAALYPSPNFNERPTGTAVDLLVIHSISLPPDEFSSGDVIDFFQNKLRPDKSPFYEQLKEVKVSSHFFVERGGRVVQFVSVYDRAWHAGVSSYAGHENCNDYSIGVEMEGCDTILFTPIQYQSLVALTQILQKHFPALRDKERIVSHAEIALPPGRKTDPGPHFDWDLYLKQC
jgi:AmpD protein